MDMHHSVQMRIGISGTLVYKDAAGNVIGTADFKGSAPLTDEPTATQNPTQPQEALHGSDHC